MFIYPSGTTALLLTDTRGICGIPSAQQPCRLGELCVPVRQLSAQCQGHSGQADAPLELRRGPSEPRGSSGFRTAPSRCCQRTRHLPAQGVQHHQGPRSAPARTSQSPNRWAPHTATLALVGTPLNPGVPAVGPGGRAGPTLHPKQAAREACGPGRLSSESLGLRVLSPTGASGARAPTHLVC